MTRTTPAVRPAGQDGYGLLELTMMIAVMAIVLAAAVPAAVTTVRTYDRHAAARHVLSAIRSAQDLAVVRGGIYAFHWGGDPGAARADAEYRVVQDTTRSCGLPLVGAAEDGTTVVQGWQDLRRGFPGIEIQSIRDAGDNLVGTVMFDSRGASVNPCASVTFPVRVTLVDEGGIARVIEVRRAGSVRLL